MKPTVFLDRDGVINVKAPPHEYITRPENFVLIDGAAEGIEMLNNGGFQVIVITNQRGIAKGKLTEDDLSSVHHEMINKLSMKGARIDGIYFCPHNEDECDCRKPGIGLLQKAEKDFPVAKSRSCFIGDSESDVLCGKNHGIMTVHIGKGNNYGADMQFETLYEAAEYLCRNLGKEI